MATDHILRGIFDGPAHTTVGKHRRALPFKAQYGHYRVKLVDPTAIRNSSLANEEFTDYQIHQDFPSLIPQHEIWLGKNVPDDERPILIHTALQELRGINRGLSKDDAYDRALKYQEHLREHANGFAPKGNRPAKVDPRCYVEKIGETKDPRFEIYLVDGKRVRDRYKADAVEGMNCCEDKFVPKGEIWIEQDVPENERPLIIVHEVFEAILMAEHGLDYAHAHDLAANVEWHYRKTGHAPALNQLTTEWVDQMLKLVGGR